MSGFIGLFFFFGGGALFLGNISVKKWFWSQPFCLEGVPLYYCFLPSSIVIVIMVVVVVSVLSVRFCLSTCHLANRRLAAMFPQTRPASGWGQAFCGFLLVDYWNRFVVLKLSLTLDPPWLLPLHHQLTSPWHSFLSFLVANISAFNRIHCDHSFSQYSVLGILWLNW